MRTLQDIVIPVLFIILAFYAYFIGRRDGKNQALDDCLRKVDPESLTYQAIIALRK